MKKLWIAIFAVVGLTLAAQATIVSWDGTSDDIVDMTENIQITSWSATDTVWSTSTLLIDSPGTQADLKMASSQFGTGHQNAQINAGLDQIYIGAGGRDDQGHPDATSGNTQIVGFNTSAFGAEDLLTMSVDIEPRYADETLAFRWFVEAGGNAYVSGVVDSDVVGVENHVLGDATIEWFNFDDTLNLEASLAALTSAGTLTLSDVAYAGIIATETWDSGTTNWRGVKVSTFSAEAIPEPATLGMIASVGVGILFIRRRVMM